MKKAIGVLALLLVYPVYGAELVRGVRYKLSAGDLPSGIAMAEDYRRTIPKADAEYLDAIGWLARGAFMLGRPDLAREYVAQLHREIPNEVEELLVPYGAAIEVESKLISVSDGRGAAIRYLECCLETAKAPALRSRITKNINLLSLEGHTAPPVDAVNRLGKPVLLYFYGSGCGDCKAQAPSLVRVWQKYKNSGLQMVATTRFFGDEQQANVDQAWKDLYSGLEGVPLVVSTDAMVRYGVSATPTFALVDRKGVVRLYTPTRMSEAELSRRIDELLTETP